ncbi:MAG: ATP-binding protein, partial [Actinomycetota bacterium]|nr:ATP-binding protein [Actinomycetota bacterium]
MISEALQGRAVSGLVLAGAAGVGKSRLAVEALGEAGERGCATAWATATRSASSIPFGALAHLLPAGLGRGTPLDLLIRARRALVEGAGGRSLALAVDDAHLLDPSSAALLLQLATTGSALVIVTLRTGEAAPDAVVALWKDRLCEYVELQALSEEEVEELLARVLGASVDGGTALALWRLTAGNVLFLRELVRQGIERGQLAFVGAGLWRWRGSFAAGTRLVDLIEMRLGDLSVEERSHLELVALGEPLEASLLEGIGGATALSGLDGRGLVEISRTGRRAHVRPAHPLYGEAVRARCPPVQVARRYGMLADALAPTGGRRREDLLRLATWRLEAGGTSEPELLLVGAARAGAVFDFALAERLADAAIEAGGGRRARYARAEAVRGQGRFAEAEALLASLAAEAETDAERSALAQARVVNLHWGLGRSAEAEAVVRAAEASITEPGARDELAAVRSWVAYFSQRPLEAIDAVSHLLTRTDISDGLGVRTALAAVPSLAMAGRAEEAVALVERWHGVAAGLAEEIPLAHHQLQAARALALHLAGELVEAEARAEEGYRLALDEGTHEGTAVWSMMVGLVALGRGSLEKAVRWLSESAAL